MLMTTLFCIIKRIFHGEPVKCGSMSMSNEHPFVDDSCYFHATDSSNQLYPGSIIWK